ncbi:MAG: DUF2889 domain-containing protein [Desulfobacterales bacterium]|nr:DUF2889 domain-containing protein [Desulfobacterales bacterium]
MITFNRSQIIGAEFPDEKTIRFSGIQEDHIYSMEINMDVHIADGTILAIKGNMKRYTNFVCPEAVPVLQAATGMSLREDGWERRIMKEIGRKGCEHFAEIIIECGRCLDQARMADAMWEALEKNPGLDQEAFMENWIEKQAEKIDV